MLITFSFYIVRSFQASFNGNQNLNNHTYLGSLFDYFYFNSYENRNLETIKFIDLNFKEKANQNENVFQEKSKNKNLKDFSYLELKDYEYSEKIFDSFKGLSSLSGFNSQKKDELIKEILEISNLIYDDLKLNLELLFSSIYTFWITEKNRLLQNLGNIGLNDSKELRIFLKNNDFEFCDKNLKIILRYIKHFKNKILLFHEKLILEKNFDFEINLIYYDITIENFIYYQNDNIIIFIKNLYNDIEKNKAIINNTINFFDNVFRFNLHNSIPKNILPIVFKS
ncbi:hypothetical protein GVAV_001843 [Gurleya vavrai]